MNQKDKPMLNNGMVKNLDMNEIHKHKADRKYYSNISFEGFY